MINRKRIVRLILYKNVLKKLYKAGETRIFSNHIADLTAEKATQVRKDFSLLKITGNRKSGYDIIELINNINTILKKQQKNEAIIIGSGKIANALLAYPDFKEENIEIVAAFDSDAAKIDPDKAVPILPMEKLDSFIRDRNIRVAIITVPAAAAQGVFDRLVAAGIGAVLNFAPVTLKNEGSVILKYVNLEVELESLFYFVNSRQRDLD